MIVYSKVEGKYVDMIPSIDADKKRLDGFIYPDDKLKVTYPPELFEIPNEIDWEQRRYEIAKATLQSLISVHCGISTWKRQSVSDAVEFADLLIKQLKEKPMVSKQRDIAVGEIVEYQGKHLLCVEQKDDEDCTGCGFLTKDDDCMFSGYCKKENRSDGKDVKFL